MILCSILVAITCTTYCLHGNRSDILKLPEARIFLKIEKYIADYLKSISECSSIRCIINVVSSVEIEQIYLISITSLHAEQCFMLMLLPADLKTIYKKNLSGTLSECQKVWIQIRADILLVLIWVQTVYKGYQQTTKVSASKERV